MPLQLTAFHHGRKAFKEDVCIAGASAECGVELHGEGIPCGIVDALAGAVVYIRKAHGSLHDAVGVHGIKVVLALLDAEGNILDIEDEYMYDNKALTPGSSMIIRKDISSSYMEYYAANGIVPASVDAIAYVNVG